MNVKMWNFPLFYIPISRLNRGSLNNGLRTYVLGSPSPFTSHTTADHLLFSFRDKHYIDHTAWHIHKTTCPQLEGTFPCSYTFALRSGLFHVYGTEEHIRVLWLCSGSEDSAPNMEYFEGRKGVGKKSLWTKNRVLKLCGRLGLGGQATLKEPGCEWRDCPKMTLKIKNEGCKASRGGKRTSYLHPSHAQL